MREWFSGFLGKEKGKEGNVEKVKPIKEYYWRVSDPEIAQLEDGVYNILSRIKTRIDAGEYKLVVGCDASGRIPTLIVERVLKELYRRKGGGPLETRFYAGAYSYITDEKRHEKLKKIFDSVAGALKEHPGRVLVVTEAVLTGTSLVPILQVLKHLRASFDVATTSSRNNMRAGAGERNYSNPLFEYMDPNNIITGEAKYAGITHNANISGVVKDYEDAFSRSYKEEYKGDPAAQRRIQQGVNNSRSDVDAVVHNLLIDYKKL
jgi:uncharacterized protein YihD (DUF1040 family)